ncbi:MAG: MFS transporter [Candidatus Sericytochromatia bacterium]|nr:MFS transporter [Candidatus Sericytochromatia bacterium]
MSDAPADASLLRTPGFLKLWLAHTVSQLGDRLHQLALMWWTMVQTGSVAQTGAVLIASTLPAVLLGPLAGTLADRVERRRLMVLSDLARAGVVAALAWLAWHGALTVPVALLASACLSALTTLFAPAALATLPSVVSSSQVMRATSWMESSQHGASLAGPVLGGLLVAGAGSAGAFALNAGSFLLSGLLLAGLPRQGLPPGPAAESFLAASRGGFRLLRLDPTVAGVLTCFATVNIFTMPVILFMPYFAREVFQVGAAGLGWMEGALGLGMLLAALALATRLRVRRPFPWVAGGIAGVALAIAAMGQWPSFPLHLAALALAGLCMGGVNVVTIAWFQGRIPPAEAGRFFGLMTSICSGLIPLSYGVYGMLAEHLAPAALLRVNAVAIGALAIALAWVPGFRRAGQAPSADA